MSSVNKDGRVGNSFYTIYQLHQTLEQYLIVCSTVPNITYLVCNKSTTVMVTQDLPAGPRRRVGNNRLCDLGVANGLARRPLPGSPP